MTTWTTISNAAVAVGGIPSSTTVTALRDNPSAIAESSSGAPVVFAGWHPYDKVSVGDGKTGLIYDHAISGNVSSVVTPDFEDGYEYRIIIVELSHNSLSDRRLYIEFYLETSATYFNGVSVGNHSRFYRWGVDAIVNIPRVSARIHTVLYSGTLGYDSNFAASGDSAGVVWSTTAQKLLRARIIYETGSDSIDGGKIYLHRRREYISVP